MKQYYYSEGVQKFGPFTLEELRCKKITKDTLIWHEGLTDWVAAYKIEEVADIIVQTPPPIPKPPSLKYYDNYEENEDVTFSGFLLLSITTISYFVSLYFKAFEEWLFTNKPLLLALITIFKIGIIIWVVKIATKQNRNTVGWGVFAFFLPSICLIVLGQQKKLRKK